jgi:hypothetical protein
MARPGHRHVSEVYAINTWDARLTGKVLELARAAR